MGLSVCSTAGNCAVWVTSGMVKAGILSKPKLFPKDVVATLLEPLGHCCHGLEACVERGDNINVVYYKQLEWSVKARTWQHEVPSLVHVLKWSSNVAYWDLLPFANVVVETASCDDDTEHASPKNTRLVVVQGSGKRMTGCLWRYHGIVIKYLIVAVLFLLPYFVGLVEHGSSSGGSDALHQFYIDDEGWKWVLGAIIFGTILYTILY
eukprot:TRINITY_DN9781_c0_g1_i4.p1 TRINITY_DN9781_c0_g1~~TRINITY_DN9781_c0_g1_i4.p1  ORF type:complete len:208 (-),score=23.35 TRINITY_DN9781_c0_g1_i4:3-626(-)